MAIKKFCEQKLTVPPQEKFLKPASICYNNLKKEREDIVEIRKILLPVDFSKMSPFVTCRGKFLAKTFSAKIILFHVLETVPDNEIPTELHAIVRGYLDDLIKGRIADMQDIEREIKEEGIKYEVIGEAGKPYEEIVRASVKYDADLIVIGNSNRIKKLILGSTAERVVRYSPKPVWVCKDRTCHSIRSILVPIDFSIFSEEAMKWGIFLAKIFEAKLTLLHIVKPIIRSPGYIKLLKEKKLSLREIAHLEMDKFLMKFDLSDLKYTTKILMGEPAKKIAQVAKKENAQLIVMGTHGRSGLSHLILGSVTEKVLENASCDILAVKPPIKEKEEV